MLILFLILIVLIPPSRFGQTFKLKRRHVLRFLSDLIIEHTWIVFCANVCMRSFVPQLIPDGILQYWFNKIDQATILLLWALLLKSYFSKSLVSDLTKNYKSDDSTEPPSFARYVPF